MKEITVELDHKYIKLVGDKFTDTHGQVPSSSPAKGFIKDLHRRVFLPPVMDEFQAGWRDVVEVDTGEDELEQFARICADMYLSDELNLEDFRYLTQPLQLCTAQKYWDDHIDALENSPVRYRKLQADNLAPLMDACDGFFEVPEILELLLEGVFENIDPFGSTHNRPRNIVEKLQDRIVENEDEINLGQEYFYQGPRRLGIIQCGKSKSIAGCVCEYRKGYLFPFFISDSDPVSKNVRRVVEDLVEDEKGIH